MFLHAPTARRRCRRRCRNRVRDRVQGRVADEHGEQVGDELDDLPSPPCRLRPPPPRLAPVDRRRRPTRRGGKRSPRRGPRGSTTSEGESGAEEAECDPIGVQREARDQHHASEALQLPRLSKCFRQRFFHPILRLLQHRASRSSEGQKHAGRLTRKLAAPVIVRTRPTTPPCSEGRRLVGGEISGAGTGQRGNESCPPGFGPPVLRPGRRRFVGSFPASVLLRRRVRAPGRGISTSKVGKRRAVFGL